MSRSSPPLTRRRAASVMETKNGDDDSDETRALVAARIAHEHEAEEAVTGKRAYFLAFFVGLAYVDWGLLFALQPPFYPLEAEQKGATPAQYGFVFGVVHLAAFLFSPILARFGNAMGAKRVFNWGGIIEGTSGIAFGFLEYVDSLTAFLGLSYALRFLNGMTGAGTWISVVSILMKLYPDKVATIMSWTEMSYGLGYTLGPAVGSALYGLGGFKLPFIVVGGLGLVVQFFLYFLLPDMRQGDVSPSRRDSDSSAASDAILDPEATRSYRDREKEAEAMENAKKPLTLKAMAMSPSLSLPFVDNAFCMCGFGFLEAMLEPHMREETAASPSDVANTFLIVGALYMVVSPATGYICDKISYPVMLSITGNLCMGLALLLIGPVPFVPLKPSTDLILGMAVPIGIGYAQIMVSSFSRAYVAAMEKGYEDDINTYLMVSGIWSASFYFGNFLGPTVAGFLVEAYGFRYTSVVFFALYCVMALVDISELLLRMGAHRRHGYDSL